MFEKSYSIQMIANEDSVFLQDDKFITDHTKPQHCILLSHWYDLKVTKLGGIGVAMPFFDTNSAKEEMLLKQNFETFLLQRIENFRHRSSYSPSFYENATNLFTQALMYETIFGKNAQEIVHETKHYTKDAQLIEEAVAKYRHTLNKPYELVA
jgi:hypothetical protein